MAERQFGHIKTPLKRIHIELTNVCDFNCAFCPKELMTRSYGYMETDLAKKPDWRNRAPWPGRKGDPSREWGNPRCIKVFSISSIMPLPSACRSELTTNGGGLGRPVGRKLLDYPLHQVDISLQTPDEKILCLEKSRKTDL